MIGSRNQGVDDLANVERQWGADPDNQDLLERLISIRRRLGKGETRNQVLKLLSQDIRQNIPENLMDIDEQYEGNLKRLMDFGVVTIPEDQDQRPYIIDFDFAEIQYPIPTFEDILRKMTPEDKRVIETINEPKLLLVPFGMSLYQFLREAESHRGRLDDEGWYAFIGFQMNVDRNRDLNYFVDQFRDPIGGYTKAEILKQKGQKNPFPGWQVLVVDGRLETDEQTIVKFQDERGNDYYKNAHDFLKEYKEKGYDGLTPEDMITLQLIGIESGTPFDKSNNCYLLNCFLKNHADPILSTGWLTNNSEMLMYKNHPEEYCEYRISRPARRIGIDRTNF